MNGLFNGTVPRRGVSMRGSSAKQESSAGILERARAARIARAAERREYQAVLTLKEAFVGYRKVQEKRRSCGENFNRLLKMWNKSGGTAEMIRPMVENFFFFYLGRTCTRLNPPNVLPEWSIPKGCTEQLNDIFDIIVEAQNRGFLRDRGQRSFYENFAMVVLQLCFQVEESSVNISDVEGALAQFRRQLRVAKLLCSNQSWSNRTSAQKITVTLMSSGLYAKIRHAILILLNASVGDVREDLTNILLITLRPFLREGTDDMDTGEQQSEQEDSCVGECAFYFTEQILTINKIVAQCTKDVRTVFETQRGANTFFQHLSLCLQSKSNLKMRLSLSKTEAMNVLTNLHLLAESCFQSLSTLDDDLLTSTTIVWSELANRIPQGVDDLESDDDDDENADNMDITTGSKESKDMFELMTPILNHPKAVVRLVLSDALPQVSAAFLRLTENNKQLKSMMLNALAFTRLDLSSSAEHAVLHRLWRACAIEPGIFPESENDVFQGNDRVNRLEDRASILVLFTQVYEHLLRIQDSAEFYSYRVPFNKEQLLAVASTLKGVLLASIWPMHENLMPSEVFGPVKGGQTSTARLLNMLYMRDTSGNKNRFASDKFWTSSIIAAQCRESRILELCKDGQQSKEVVALDQILKTCPFFVPFEARVQIFHEKVSLEVHDFREISITIRRKFILEDAYSELNHRKRELRWLIKVRFLDENGLLEVGVDGGGLFKEFMHSLVARAFSPSLYGLMKATWENKLYPNPASEITAGPNHLNEFEFLGRILGKALQESILINLPLAEFFLTKLLGRNNNLDNLSTFDPELHRNLLRIKKLSASEVEELGLNFTIVNNEYDGKEVPLIPNGENIAVTASNRLEYIYRVANYRLNTQIKNQSKAFLTGLSDVVNIDMIQMFSPSELQMLIQGKESRVDTEDLRHHTVYKGYSDDSQTIQWFWEILHDMEEEDVQKLLQFVTSSPYAPLLGFKYLRPHFAIHRVPCETEGERLPTASTCINLLKLPDYSTKEMMREKLMYSIHSNAGFDLS